jgi:hypothetical protein
MDCGNVRFAMMLAGAGLTGLLLIWAHSGLQDDRWLQLSFWGNGLDDLPIISVRLKSSKHLMLGIVLCLPLLLVLRLHAAWNCST